MFSSTTWTFSGNHHRNLTIKELLELQSFIAEFTFFYCRNGFSTLKKLYYTRIVQSQQLISEIQVILLNI